MKRIFGFLSLLILVSQLPQIAAAQDFQIFAQQGMVVGNVLDHNDRPLSAGVKTAIRQSLIDAVTASGSFVVYEVNEEDARKALPPGSDTPPIMRKKLCELAAAKSQIGDRVDHFVEIVVNVSSSAINAQDISIYINASLYRASTETLVKSYQVESKPTGNAIMEATAELVENLLGVSVDRQRLPPQHQGGNQQQPVQRQPVQQQPDSSTPASYVENADCGLGMKMIYVEGGSFQMGATSEQSGAYGDERPVHTVQLDSYYIAECEVTQEQWEKVMGSTVYQQRDKADASWPMRGVGNNYPMYYVSWNEAQAFCQELSLMTGKTYLLPTEAQWEYAARGGKKSRGNNQFSGSYSVDAVAWYESNSGNSTHPVKQKRANELGLYDMSGNVWEWCSDWYGGYSSGEQFNPTGPGSGQYRVLRGGGWSNSATNCRVAGRFCGTPSDRYNGTGFRVVCLP